MTFITRRDTRLYAYDTGPAEGTPVLLLHGIGNSGRAWQPQAEALAAAGYRVIMPDFAGHGASGPILQRCTVDTLCADTLAWLAHYDIDAAHIAGLSLGGMVAQALALSAPARVRSATIACSFAHLAGEGHRALLQQWQQLFRQPGGCVTRFENSWPLNLSAAFRDSAEGRSIRQQWHAQAAMSDGESLALLCEGLADFDLRDRLPSLQVPALFLAGEGDVLAPPASVAAMAACVPDARFDVIPGAAHVANVDSAAGFSQRLLDFITRH